MKIICTSLFALLVLACSTPALADDFALAQQKAATGEAEAQYALARLYDDKDSDRHDRKKAFAWYTKSAEQGHARAQLMVGAYYYRAWDPVERDLEKAFEWFLKAAEQGNATAQYNVATMYDNSQGTRYSYAEVIKWNTKAAEQGNLAAQRSLGISYANGWGNSPGSGQDYANARKWLHVAAKQNDACAQFNLGFLSEKGYGLDQPDIPDAITWYALAADQNYVPAQNALAAIYLDEKGPGPQKERYAKAEELLRAAAARNSIDALWKLANMYYRGDTAPRDYARALACARQAAGLGQEYSVSLMRTMYHTGLFPERTAKNEAIRKLAEAGDAEARFQYGKLLAEGNFIKPNYREAYKWYALAAEQGNLKAMNNLGALYMDGKGVPKDNSKAVHWFAKAAEQGHPTAQNSLGHMYEWGKGVRENWSTAAEWYEKAAMQGFAVAMDNLGFMYETGAGVPKDYEKAAAWFRKGADLDCASACFHLASLYREGHGVPASKKMMDHWYDRFHELNKRLDFHLTDTSGEALP